jgi:hypothetical protein
MLILEIYRKNKVIYTYIIMYEGYETFYGSTYNDFYTWLKVSDFTEQEVITLEARVGYAVDIQFPNHFYKFKECNKTIKECTKNNK